jgi:ribosomal protein S18 acetylase RimI-like enzyme
MSPFELRPALVSDSAGIAAVHVETWQVAYKDLLLEDHLSRLNIADRTKSWSENLGNSELKTRTIVALDSGIVVGFIKVGASEDDPEFNNSAEIWALYVHPTKQGLGIGNLLLDEGLKVLEIDGFDEVELWVLKDNLKARHWYESKGWEFNGKTKAEINAGFTSTFMGYAKLLSRVTGTP